MTKVLQVISRVALLASQYPKITLMALIGLVILMGMLAV